MADDQATYASKGSRLDWILLSPDLRFQKHAVISEIVSDHFAVAAEIVQDQSP
jgi:endonuclease/exonuclease/phosphatase family metal-dependent hydrolase